MLSSSLQWLSGSVSSLQGIPISFSPLCMMVEMVQSEVPAGVDLWRSAEVAPEDIAGACQETASRAAIGWWASITV